MTQLLRPLRHILSRDGRLTICGYDVLMLSGLSRKIATRDAELASCPRCIERIKAPEAQGELFNGPEEAA